MKLMRLKPESQRLRRIARAHAAGEFTKAEYRQARRALLRELTMLQAGEGSHDDLTYRRDDVTTRVGERTQPTVHTLKVQPVASAVATKAIVHNRRFSFSWFIIGLGAVVALLWIIPLITGA